MSASFTLTPTGEDLTQTLPPIAILGDAYELTIENAGDSAIVLRPIGSDVLEGVRATIAAGATAVLVTARVADAPNEWRAA